MGLEVAGTSQNIIPMAIPILLSLSVPASCAKRFQVILAMWTQEQATFEGTYYQVRDAIKLPKGVQRPHIPLLIGGSGEQITLKLVAQL